MTLNQDIFAVKLYEMEKQYGRLQSRLRICGRENRKKLQAELEHAKEEYEENSLLLKQSIQGSRSPAVAELAQVQWEYMHKVEDLLKEKGWSRSSTARQAAKRRTRRRRPPCTRSTPWILPRKPCSTR